MQKTARSLCRCLFPQETERLLRNAVKSAADGLPPILVSTSDTISCYDFALTTRQVFSDVTGRYVDFPLNGTTDIIVNVVCNIQLFRDTMLILWNQTLGILHGILPIPVTFSANVYLDYNEDCTIDTARAFAQIPTNIANLLYLHFGYPAPFATIL